MAALRPASVLQRTRNARFHPVRRLAKRWQSAGSDAASVNFEMLLRRMEQEYPDPDGSARRPPDGNTETPLASKGTPLASKETPLANPETPLANTQKYAPPPWSAASAGKYPPRPSSSNRTIGNSVNNNNNNTTNGNSVNNNNNNNTNTTTTANTTANNTNSNTITDLFDIDDIDLDQTQDAAPQQFEPHRTQPTDPRTPTTPPDSASPSRAEAPSSKPPAWIKPPAAPPSRRATPPPATSSSRIKPRRERPEPAEPADRAPRPTRRVAPAPAPAPAPDALPARESVKPEAVTTITLDKTHGRVFDNVFLRDSCTCDQCVDTSTRQKKFATTDISRTIRPRHVFNHDTHVDINWENDMPAYGKDHLTRLSRDFLIQAGHHPHVTSYEKKKRLWDDDTLREKGIHFTYAEYMSIPGKFLGALRHLNASGLIFINNVPELESSVVEIANRIGPLKNTFYGDTWDVRSVTNAKNVAYTSIDLGFHMDLLYMQQPPRLQLLHCLRASTHGGVSLFTDSYRAAWMLYTTDRPSFDILASHPVNFHYDNDSHLYHQTRRVFELNAPIPDKLVESSRFFSYLNAVNWAPPFQGPFHSADHAQFPTFSIKMREWHRAAQKFRDLVETKSAVYERQMAPGECAIFDNRRVLHARTAFHGGERWLRGAYIDDDPFLSKLRVSERDAAENERKAAGEARVMID